MSSDKHKMISRKTNLPDYIDRRLQVEAQKNGRSLANQIRVFVERALLTTPYNPNLKG